MPRQRYFAINFRRNSVETTNATSKKEAEKVFKKRKIKYDIILSMANVYKIKSLDIN